MLMHVQKFVDRVRAFESRGTKDFSMSMSDAKDLHADITRMLVQLENLKTPANNAPVQGTVTVQIEGGTFK